MTYTPIKTAVIGYGYSAKTFHLPFIQALPELELCAISSSQRAAVETDWAQAQWYDNAETLLDESQAELVIITAPNDVHFPLAKRALEKGKHVIVEKPFVTRMEEGKALITLAQEKGLVLSVFHNRRWDGDFLTVKKLIEAGSLGEVRLFESHFDRYRPEIRQRWREQAQEGGGILFDLAPHLLDQALVLFGLPQAIHAQCRMMRPGATTIDYYNLILHYPNHLVHLHSNLYSPEPNLRYKILGTLAKYEKMGLDPQEAQLKKGVEPIGDQWASEDPTLYGQQYSESGAQTIATECGGYQHYFKGVADAIRLGSENPVPAEQALQNIALIELALESSQTGKTLNVEHDLV
ncbi:putative dehydrogenase [Vibrio cincinnatiensis]|jgi:predicted dehydrogenase|uniref:Predicted dehydrogenase n=1 Tax=Vibrio cincinnatiensis DSM 19608 TaxID=1123491 RepID=A0A1T4NSB7_VIBCI|nr:oxidoreductase [Vibrio cincinnatiensis]SJZ82072.1 Predicted dehydrogenase [Vibrio cincinnatiensis DSM 19608]SUP05445.1 putative dehydrogenase [Vibrio cincinnatiensis]